MTTCGRWPPCCCNCSRPVGPAGWLGCFGAWRLRVAGGPRRDASWLARHLMSVVPDARLPGPGRTDAAAPAAASTPAEDDHQARYSGPLRRITAVPPGRLVGVGAGLCILATGGAVLAERGAASGRLACPGPGPWPRRRARLWTTAAARSRGPEEFVVGPAGRYAIGQPGDVVVMGRWGCGPTAFPAVLRPGTGDVWTFDSWATSADPVVGRFVGRVASAWSLRVVPGRSGCDGLEIVRRNLPPVAIPVVTR